MVQSEVRAIVRAALSRSAGVYVGLFSVGNASILAANVHVKLVYSPSQGIVASRYLDFAAHIGSSASSLCLSGPALDVCLVPVAVRPFDGAWTYQKVLSGAPRAPSFS